MPSEVRVDRASRRIKASPERIHASFLDAEALASWLPPEGMRGTVDRLEPRVGGSFSVTLTYIDASDAAPGKTTEDSDRVEGRFAEIVENERIVWEVDFESDDPAFAGTMRMTWTFEPVADGTLVSIAAENVPSGISKKDHDTGLRSSLEQLAAHVE